MLDNKDYFYKSVISTFKSKIEIAACGAKEIDMAVRELGEKYKIPTAELDQVRNGIFDLQNFLEQK